MIYLDHNATTPIRPEVLDAMLPYLRGEYGNPSSVYGLGQRARRAIEKAREQIARFINSETAQEIVFTSGGSESDATAVVGGAWQSYDDSRGTRRRIVATKIEHDAVRGTLTMLHRRGFAVDELGVNSNGVVIVDEAAAQISETTAVVSVMHSNNEIGTIQPVAAIAAACRAQGVLCHTDAVQSAGKIPIDARALGVDLLALSGHKIGGPKGIGVLYVRKGVRLSPLVLGHQEKNRRGGTENVAAIVGLGVACELAGRELEISATHHVVLCRRIEEAVRLIAGAAINGYNAQRLPNTVHISFPGLDGHQLVIALDIQDIAVSGGPACSSGSPEPSHVLRAMGIDPTTALSSLRISLGWNTTSADVGHFLSVLPGAVEKLRKLPAQV